MTVQHNTSVHQEIIASHFLTPQPFFLDFCPPDCCVAITGDDEDFLREVLQEKTFVAHDLFMVNNTDVSHMMHEIQRCVLNAVSNGDTEPFAAYIAVWSPSNANHSFIGVALNCNHKHQWDCLWDNLSVRNIAVMHNDLRPNYTDMFDSMEYMLQQDINISSDFLTILGTIGWQHEEYISRVHNLIEGWDCGVYSTADDKQYSLMVSSVEMWAAAQQHQTITQAIEHIPGGLSKRKI
jgi:hypothetical protein